MRSRPRRADGSPRGREQRQPRPRRHRGQLLTAPTLMKQRSAAAHVTDPLFNQSAQLALRSCDRALGAVNEPETRSERVIRWRIRPSFCERGCVAAGGESSFVVCTLCRPGG
ncbi:hypothetical protein AAFF_G00088240 [Aldrovandia affinis]|uniref:Uncharacterized protein n=1 Tax=Aldrovandia affinis TaxID=143900 RepID=A0AAD7RWD6_9TELE|nr:hypothetical protein AAFF_G00088240 [Aldrovandia affinis]